MSIRDPAQKKAARAPSPKVDETKALEESPLYAFGPAKTSFAVKRLSKELQHDVHPNRRVDRQEGMSSRNSRRATFTAAEIEEAGATCDNNPTGPALMISVVFDQYAVPY